MYSDEGEVKCGNVTAAGYVYNRGGRRADVSNVCVFVCRDSRGGENNGGHVNQRVFSLRDDRNFARDDLTVYRAAVARELRIFFFTSRRRVVALYDNNNMSLYVYYII